MTTLFFSTADFEVKDFPDRQAIDEIQMVMSAFDCVLADDSAIYCSSEITTGKRFYYEVLMPRGVTSDAELKEKLDEEEYKQLRDGLIRQNIDRGREFTEKLQEGGLVNLLTPGPFYAKRFTQKHYMYLWEFVIIKKAYEIRFAADWEYSDGCTLEYAVALKKGIPRFDHLGDPLDVNRARQKVETAIAELKGQGFKVEGLEVNLARLNINQNP